MREATAQANLTLVVLYEAYLKASYTQPEWAAAFAQDPTGKDRRLIPGNGHSYRDTRALHLVPFRPLDDNVFTDVSGDCVFCHELTELHCR